MASRPNAATQAADTFDAARSFFEPQLLQLGLGEDQIGSQTLPELRSSLETIDKAIDHPESFGTLRISFNSTVGVLLVKAESPAHLEVGILPILLERRRLIMDRIRTIEVEDDVTKLEEEIARGPQDSERAKALEEELEEKRREEIRLRERLAAEQQVRETTYREDLLLQVEVQAKKTAIRQSWIARESVASLVGGLLLVALATTLIVAMFSATAVSEIISNAFLVILGYFFGQAGRERTTGDESSKAS